MPNRSISRPAMRRSQGHRKANCPPEGLSLLTLMVFGGDEVRDPGDNYPQVQCEALLSGICAEFSVAYLPLIVSVGWHWHALSRCILWTCCALSIVIPLMSFADMTQSSTLEKVLPYSVIIAVSCTPLSGTGHVDRPRRRSIGRYR